MKTPYVPHLFGAAALDRMNGRRGWLSKVPLTHAAIKRMSLAGAQHKLAVVLQDGALFGPAGATPSTHILNPDHPNEDYPHSVINEWFVMRLAKRLGLDVPVVHRRYAPSPVYLIDRFDRYPDGDAWQRRHVIDACQLLGLDRSFKYRQGSMDKLAALANACRSPAVARTRLFGWLVFNVLVGNSDAHLMQEAEALYAEIEAENAPIAHARPDLSVTMAGESRCLRAILHTVLKEMAKLMA